MENKKPDIICGCYLIGMATFEPDTLQHHYWIKVGKSSGVKNRIQTYYTYNPMILAIDFKAKHWDKMHELEFKCHKKLSEKCLQIANHTHEWFEVTRDLYLTICDFGFKYFED